MDFKEMASNIGVETEDFIELLEMLVDVSLADITKFEDAVASGDYSKAAMAAHSIKGASGNLGFKDISALAAELESAAKNSDRSLMEDGRVITLKEEFSRIQGLLS